MNTIGIDPGWASCGLAVNIDGKIECKSNFEPRSCATNQSESFIAPLDYITAFSETISRRLADFDVVYMERYVAYKGIHSDMSENILMFIGAVKAMFELRRVKVEMVRAIDWKPKVCKYLVRTAGFNNPYPSFDKKFSILAAETLSGVKFKTDHEADAVCLSYLGIIDEYNKEHKK